MAIYDDFPYKNEALEKKDLNRVPNNVTFDWSDILEDIKELAIMGTLIPIAYLSIAFEHAAKPVIAFSTKILEIESVKNARSFLHSFTAEGIKSEADREMEMHQRFLNKEYPRL